MLGVVLSCVERHKMKGSQWYVQLLELVLKGVFMICPYHPRSFARIALTSSAGRPTFLRHSKIDLGTKHHVSIQGRPGRNRKVPTEPIASKEK
eukprot:4588286-Amphidinium_carterae.2